MAEVPGLGRGRWTGSDRLLTVRRACNWRGPRVGVSGILVRRQFYCEACVISLVWSYSDRSFKRPLRIIALISVAFSILFA